MTPLGIREPRRVLLSLGAEADMRLAIEAAVTFASAAKSQLLCLLVEQQDLINFAGLPFARAYGLGGFAETLTLHGIESHFNRLARTAEKTLTETCARTNVTWTMTRPQGETMQELSMVLAEGDVVVVNLRDLRDTGHTLIGAARNFLGLAAAIVVPAPTPILGGPIIAISDGPGTRQAAAIAQGLAQATGNRVVVMDAWNFLHFHNRAMVVVAPLDIIATMGERVFLHQIDAVGATAMLVSE